MLDIRASRDCRVAAYAHFADILNVKHLVPMLILTQLATVAVGIFDAVKAAAVLETGKSRFFSTLQAAKALL